MINNPQSESYYEELCNIGYNYFAYSEKHYVFEKDGRIIKIAKSAYNNEYADESFFIEQAAHDILRRHNLPVAEIFNVYPKGMFLKNHAVLEEEKVEGNIYYKKDSERYILSQALHLMQGAANIKGKQFGMMQKDGTARYSSWREFLYSIVEKMPKYERAACYDRIDSLPQAEEPVFIFTDCNMANFIFCGDILKKAIDVERPLWGDKAFLSAVIKRRNPYMYKLVKETSPAETVDFYASIYPYIF